MTMLAPIKEKSISSISLSQALCCKYLENSCLFTSLPFEELLREQELWECFIYC